MQKPHQRDAKKTSLLSMIYDFLYWVTIDDLVQTHCVALVCDAMSEQIFWSIHRILLEK